MHQMKKPMKEKRKSCDINLDHSDVEQQTELMYTNDTIWTAVFNADKKAIEVLLEDNPKVIEARGPVGECPVHMLFLYGTEEHMVIARDLITRFPQIVTQIYNKPIYYGENILHLAIVKRNAVMVEWLMSNEHLAPYREELLTAATTGEFFRMGKPSYYGESPLGFACCTSQWDIVEILLKHGADIDTADGNGNTILHMLVIRSLPEMYEKYKARWIEQQKVSGHRDTDKKKTNKLQLWDRLNNDRLTPLTLAANLRRTEMFTWLLQERLKIQWSFGDVTCVLHPLNQLDFDFPQEDTERPLSVLEVIIRNNDSELVHPIITSLIDTKWKHFVHRTLIRRFLVTFVYLLIFLITTILDQSRSELVLEEEGVEEIGQYPVGRFLCRIGHLIVLTGAALKSAREIGEMYSMGLREYLHTTGSIFLENSLACSFCICIFTVEFLRLFDMPNATVILALASLIGWAYMFFFIMPFRFTGPFVIMIYKMLFNDVLRFCMIYLIFLGGFSQSFFILFHENGFVGYLSTIRQCFLGLLGDFDLDIYVAAPYPVTSVTLLICYVLVVTILLLNLLIAMMGDTYADVKKGAKKLWHLERARIALDVENGMTTAERKLAVNKYWVDVQGQRYLQVEQVNNDLFNATSEQSEED